MPRSTYPILTPVGEDAVLVEYAPEVNLETNQLVRQLAYGLEKGRIAGMTEVVPAYRSLMVYFDPERADVAKLFAKIKRVADRPRETKLPEPRLFRIPTVYGGRYGPDLESVARTTGLAQEEVIRLFSSQKYPVYCLGFLCCLAYLGGVPEQLRLPRLTTPRTWLPAGSVGFAEAQAVVLPIDQPSGFHYIGRTFLPVYDPAQFPPTPIRPGDYLECLSVSEDEAKQWQNRTLGDCVDERV
jgi:KipI family sensor histidine kinase inhibitor